MMPVEVQRRRMMPVEVQRQGRSLAREAVLILPRERACDRPRPARTYYTTRAPLAHRLEFGPCLWWGVHCDCHRCADITWKDGHAPVA